MGLHEPKLIGTLSAHHVNGKKALTFEYDVDWIQSKEQILLY
jgi:hypothetical protein